MSCITCTNRLPTNNYALVDGVYFCLTCFLEQYNSLPPPPIACQTCGSIHPSSSKTTSDSRKEKFSSTTSLNSIQSSKISETARRVSTAITKTFHRLRSPSPAFSNDQKPPRSSKTCQVCFDEKSSKYFRPIFNHQCGQTQRTICDKCVYRHIEQSFREMCTNNVRCPELECNIIFNYDTIKNILILNKNRKLLERYDRFIMYHQFEQMDDFIWCSNPKCQMGQLNDGGQSNNIVTCIYCRKKTCFIHKISWHEGLTCEEYDSQTNHDLKLSLRWLNQNTKTCPNCPYQIEKNDGCDHMTCIKCQYEFCWSCLANYDPIRRDGNHRHHLNCKHYVAYDK